MSAPVPLASNPCTQTHQAGNCGRPHCEGHRRRHGDQERGRGEGGRAKGGQDKWGGGTDTNSRQSPNILDIANRVYMRAQSEIRYFFCMELSSVSIRCSQKATKHLIFTDIDYNCHFKKGISFFQKQSACGKSETLEMGLGLTNTQQMQ